MQVEQRRQTAAENLVLRRQLETKAAEAEDAVTALVHARRTAQDAALQAKHADERTLQKTKSEARRISPDAGPPPPPQRDEGDHGR